MFEAFEFSRKGNPHYKLIMNKEEFDTLQRLMIRMEMHKHPEMGSVLAHALMPEEDGVKVLELVKNVRKVRAKPELTEKEVW